MNEINEELFAEFGQLVEQSPTQLDELVTDVATLRDQVHELNGTIEEKQTDILQWMEQLQSAMSALMADADLNETEIAEEMTIAENHAIELTEVIGIAQETVTSELEGATTGLTNLQESLSTKHQTLDTANQEVHETIQHMVSVLDEHQQSLSEAQETVQLNVEALGESMVQAEEASMQQVSELMDELQATDQMVVEKVGNILEQFTQHKNTFESRLGGLTDETLTDAIAALNEEANDVLSNELVGVLRSGFEEVDGSVATLDEDTAASSGAAAEERGLLESALDVLGDVLSPLEAVIDVFRSIASGFGISIG